jgi:hypothetical protein
VGVARAVPGAPGSWRALFVVSPLTAVATGWIAASFDQLYILFCSSLQRSWCGRRRVAESRAGRVHRARDQRGTPV